MVELDGAYGEGGGQILRTALSLSAILKQPFHITSIRRTRKRPGLQPQHLTSVNAAARICGAHLTGNEIGSTELSFTPGPISSGSYSFNIAERQGSAGSATLVLQTVLPILLFARNESLVTVRGGTHVPLSPCYDYFAEVLVPFLRRLGFDLRTEARVFGFFPVGDGEVRVTCAGLRADRLVGIDLPERGALNSRHLVSGVSRLPVSIAERQRDRFFALHGEPQPTAELKTVPGQSPGTYVFFHAGYAHVTAGFTGLGRPGKPAEEVAEDAWNEFDRYRRSTGALDRYLADQVLIYLALIGKPFRYGVAEVTSHLLTNLWAIRRFLPDAEITIDGDPGQPGIVRGGPCPSMSVRGESE